MRYQVTHIIDQRNNNIINYSDKRTQSKVSIYLIFLFILFKFVSSYNKFYTSARPETPSTSKAKGTVMSRLFKRRNVEYVDEIQTYLSLSVADENMNPLEWWRVNESQFPCLSQMARDYLS